MENTKSTTTLTPKLGKSIRLRTASRDEFLPEATIEKSSSSGIDISGEQLPQISLNVCRVIDLRAGGSSFEGSVFVDCEIERADLSNSDFHMSRMERCVVRDSRLTGVSFNETRLIDVRFADCRIDLGGFRLAKTTRVAFDQCELSNVDFRDADLSDVVFDSCNLNNSDFSGSTLTGADLRRSKLEGIVIAPEQLRSVTVTSDQALFLCGLLGLVIDDW